MARKTVLSDSKPLVVFLGVVEIITSLIMLLASTGLVVFMVLSSDKSVSGLFSVTAFLGALSILVFVLGVGMIRIKKWAHKINLALSWMNFGFVVLFAVIFIIEIGYRIKALRNENSAEDIALSILSGIIIAVPVVFCGAMPLISAVLLKSANVVKTFAKYDKKKYPLLGNPVKIFTIEVILVISVFFYLMLCIEGVTSPFFGIMIKGWAARLFYGALTVLTAVTVLYVHRLTKAGWNLLLASVFMMFIPTVVTYLVADPSVIMKDMSGEDLGSAYSKMVIKLTLYGMAAGAVLCTGYMLYLRRFFRK